MVHALASSSLVPVTLSPPDPRPSAYTPSATIPMTALPPDHYAPTEPESGLKGIWHKVKDFLKKPEGKLLVGGAVAAGLIFTPILPMTIKAIGGGLSGLGSGLAGLGGTLSTAGHAVSGAASGVASGLGGASSAITTTLSKPFFGALAGGALGSYVTHKLMDKKNEPANPTQPAPYHPAPLPPVTEVPSLPPVLTNPADFPLHPPVWEKPASQTSGAVDKQARQYILELSDRVEKLSTYVKSQPAGKPSQDIQPAYIKVPTETFNKMLDKIGSQAAQQAPQPAKETVSEFRAFSNAKDSVKVIKGIGEGYTRRLEKAGIRNIGDLLEKTATAAGRRQLAQKTGISSGLLLTWANHADLMRIDGANGIGPANARLLEAAGVDTLAELAQRNPKELLETLRKTNEEQDLIQRLPSQATLEKWIAQAQKMNPILTY